MTPSSLYSVPIQRLPAVAVAGTHCPACRATPGTVRFAIGGYPMLVLVCRNCGSGWCDPQPSASELRSFYPPTYYGNDGNKFGGVLEWVVRRMTRRQAVLQTRGLEPGGRVLDVGCGRGDLIRELANLGFEAHGTELTEVPGMDASSAQVHVGDDLKRHHFLEGSFDLVVLWHVLEHLPDPAATLQEAQRILRPGGRLVVAVPNFSSWQASWLGAASFHLDLPRHLQHFSRNGLEHLLGRHGFEVIGEAHFSLRQNPFGWVQSLLNRVPGFPRNGLYEVLQNRPPDAPSPCGTGMRGLLLAFAALLTPPALGLSVLAALARRGATVTMTAVRQPMPIE